MRTCGISSRWLVAVVWIGLAWRCAAAPVFRVVDGQAGGTNRLRNGDFEVVTGTSFSGWSAAPNGYRVATGEGRGGSRALGCSAPDTTGWRGANQTLVLNRTATAPLKVGGWSRAEGVTGSRDSGYSLYVDVLYMDGTPLWGQTATFGAGTHDWEHREVLILPEKPVKSLTVHCLLRGHGGQAWFDEVSVTEISAGDGAFIYQGTPMTAVAGLPAPDGERREVGTADGLRLSLSGQRVLGVRLGDRDLATGGPGGFFARDLATGSDLFPFVDGMCPELGLRLETTVKGVGERVVVEGRLADLRGGDRAVLLVFALPVEASGWTWAEDIRGRRTIAGSGEFTQVNGVGCGTTGGLSAYPVAAIHDERSGLALALDMDRPAQYRLAYHAGARQFLVAFDFGLVPETIQFPGAALFRFEIFRFDPAWGFRSAWERYTGFHPEHFVVRSREQGIWMPFTDVSTVAGWEDFGFRYHEGNNNVGWDDAHGVLSFRYTEPMTWWMSMDPALPRTLTEAVRVRDTLATGSSGSAQRMAQVSRTAAMWDADGQPALQFRNEPWANGAVWSLNPNPRLPGTPNAATIAWNEAYRTNTYGPGARVRLDGEYLDSLEGYVTADLNHRRDHFQHTTVPLTFTTDTRRPALFKGLAVYEFTRWISEEVHRSGGLMFANGVPYRFGFLCPWLDVLGTETDWLTDGAYRPPADAQLRLWRTLSGAKPYLLLMNTDYDRLTPELVERYFQRSLFYGFHPSMFSHNASENPYWRNPKWYERDRPMFRKYIPLIRQVAEAGWQPVTGAACDAPGVLVERFGPAADGSVCFTLLNETAQAQSGVLRLVAPVATETAPGTVTELVSGQRLERQGAGWRVTVGAGATAVVRMVPGPRFLRSETAPAGRVRLTIETPPGLAQVLEISRDLRTWQSVTTQAPAASPFVLEVAQAAEAAECFYRLRW